MEVRVDGVRLRYHHIVFALHYGRFAVGLVDHRDRDHTNNEPSNLREATPLQSSWNRNPAGSRNKSGAMGVVWDKARGKWVVRVMARGTNHNFGRWDDFEFAELVAQEARRKLHGEFALLRT